MLNPSAIPLNRPLSYWVGKGSPIRELVKLQRRPIDFPFHVWGTRISQDLEARLPETADRFVGCGISEIDENAIAAACGEALERYVFAISSDLLEELPIRQPDDDLSADFIFELPFLLPKTISRQAWCEQAIKAPRRILPCWKLGADGQLVEAQLPVEFLTLDESVSLFQTTNGMACGVSLEDAIDRGLREVIERDSLMLVWLYQTGGTCLDPVTVLPSHYVEHIRRMEHRGITTMLRDISTVPGYRVILGIVGHFPETGTPIFGFGAGADIDPVRAASHGFREACLGWKGVSWRVGVGGWQPAASDEQESLPRSFVEHAALYFEPEMVPQVSFLFETASTGIERRSGGAGERVSGGAGEWESGRAGDGETGRRGDAGNSQSPITHHPFPKDIYILDLTTPDVREMGVYVVKVIVPGLVPFYFADRGADELAATRLPLTIGGTLVTGDRSPNPLPHPWP